LKPWINETMITTAVTPMIIPSKVRADRKRCDQIALAASFTVSFSSMRFPFVSDIGRFLSRLLTTFCQTRRVAI